MSVLDSTFEKKVRIHFILGQKQIKAKLDRGPYIASLEENFIILWFCAVRVVAVFPSNFKNSSISVLGIFTKKSLK